MRFMESLFTVENAENAEGGLIISTFSAFSAVGVFPILKGPTCR